MNSFANADMAMNPRDSVVPDMGILDAFGQTWTRLAGAICALLTAATGDVRTRITVLAGPIGLPVIVGAIPSVGG
jgi:hypothetical protein